jgi:hypothetical protein
MSRSAMPTVGNLAWAPMASVDEVEILDRFNGVPTFGIVRGSAGSHLFWRAVGYVPDHASFWLYVPLGAVDEVRLRESQDEDFLNGIVHQSPVERYVTLAVAWDNRILFEREWLMPAGLNDLEFKRASLRFLTEALQIKIEQGLPASRLEIMRAASAAMKEMAVC